MNELKYAPYSHSRISCHTECPKKFYYNYVEKRRVSVNRVYFEKGTWFHYVLEHFPNIPPKKFKFHFPENEAKKELFKEQAKKIIAVGTEIHDLLTKYSLKREQIFGISKEFEGTVKKKNMIITGFIDYIGQRNPGELIIADWKTGKSKVKNEQQLEIYALWALLTCPNINTIRGAFYYLEQDRKHEIIYTRDMVDDLKTKISETINKIEIDTTFERKVTEKCHECEHFNYCEPMKIKLKKD